MHVHQFRTHERGSASEIPRPIQLPSPWKLCATTHRTQRSLGSSSSTRRSISAAPHQSPEPTIPRFAARNLTVIHRPLWSSRDSVCILLDRCLCMHVWWRKDQMVGNDVLVSAFPWSHFSFKVTTHIAAATERQMVPGALYVRLQTNEPHHHQVAIIHRDAAGRG